MVRYNNKYEKNQRKKLQNISKKNEQQTTAGKKEFTTDPWLEKEYKDLKSDNTALLTKVTANHAGKTFFLYDLESWNKFEAKFTKNLEKELSKFFVVWDFVYYQNIKDSEEFEIVGRKKRNNKLARVKWDANRLSLWDKKEQIFAVNIDYGIIVASAIQPNFNPWMVERYLLLFEYHGIKPVLCITKNDLALVDPEELQLFIDLWLELFFITKDDDDELMRFKEFISNKTVVFVWNSWVGKTSLTNKIYGEQIWKEWNTSERTGYWKHTTTSSTVYEWSDKSFVIDTPWIMNLNLFEATKENLKYLFSDFAELNNECKYKKCTHTREPDCAVVQAFEDDIIQPARFALYLNLYQKLSDK